MIKRKLKNIKTRNKITTSFVRCLSVLMILIILPVADFAEASSAPQGVTLQGTILTPGSLPQEGASVAFTIQIKSPGAENCLLYEETHTLNMSNSGGAFSLIIGSGTRSGVNFEDTSTLAQIFNNAASAMTSLSCASGTSYTPVSTHSRNVIITFDDGSGPQTLTQALSVQAVPFALQADKLQGKAASEFVQTVDGNSQTRFASVFDTRYAELDAILNGTSTLYAGDNGANFTPTSSLNLNSQAITNLATPTNSTDAANKSYSDGNIGGMSVNAAAITALAAPDAGKVLSWSGTQWTASTISASPGGATTQVQFNSAGTFAGDSNFIWDNTNKRLGIGTTSPLRQLHVATSSAATPSMLALHNTDTTDTGGMSFSFRGDTTGAGATTFKEMAALQVRFETHDDSTMASSMRFYTSSGGVNSERLRITNTGSVGIGTATVGHYGKLDVRGGGATFPIVYVTNTGDGVAAFSLARSGGPVGAFNSPGGQWNMYRHGSSSSDMFAIGYNGGTDAINVTTTGLVGIGTGAGSAPTSRLNIKGTGDTSATSSLHVTSSGNSSMFYVRDDGNIGIGTNGPTTKLQVAGVISPSVDNTHDLGAAALRFKDIYAANNVIQTSDARLKTEVKDSDLGLDFINNLRPVSYYWKEGDPKLHYGVIAQEAEKALSDAKKFSGRENEVDNVIVTHDEKTDRYGVRYTELIAPIIKAIQELYSGLMDHESRFATQDREIASVKAENQKLKQENTAQAKQLDAMKAYLCAKDKKAAICK